MPFRERVKAVLRRSNTPSSSDGSGSSTPRMPTEKEIDKWNRQNLPPSKYRRPVDPKHKEHLEAFSFGRKARRRSAMSQYSPMGSRLPSRRNSGSGTPGRKSMQIHHRGDSVGGVGKVVENAEDDTDTGNVGLSRKNTNDTEKTPQPSEGTATPPDPDMSLNPAIKLNSEQPFTQQDLDLALQRSRSKSTRVAA